jgi:Tol biopolymer transport system component
MTMRATMAGLIMGTAGYMSPEQAKGKPVDRRADIWAFGIVFAEMLTGRAMYTGETVSEILAAVIMKEPEIPDSVPPYVRTLLRRCLERDPLLRLQAIGEARIAIDRPPAAELPAPAAAAAKSRSPRLLIASRVAISLVIVTLAALLFYATRPIDRPLQRFNADLGPDTISGPRVSAAISPDGTRLAFFQRAALGTVLATRLMDQSKATVLAGTENPFEMVFSPDGQWLAFYADQKLKKVSILGGSPVTVCDASQMRGATWGDDGYIYASINGTQISRVPAAGGTPELVAHLADNDEHAAHPHRWPQFLPGAGAILVTAGQQLGTGWDDAVLEVLSLKTGRFQTVQRGGYYGRYLPSGHLVFVHQGTLFATPFDLRSMAARGMPAPILEDVAGAISTGAGQFDFSRTGTFVYLSGKTVVDAIPPVWLDAAGAKKVIFPTPPARLMGSAVSPDGKRIAASVNSDISVYDPARGALLRLSFTPAANNQYPVWTPDGKHIAFGPGIGGIWWVRSDGSGQPQLIYEVKNANAIPTSFSPDGRWLAFHQVGVNASRDIYTLPLDLTDPDHPKAGKPELFLASPAADVEARFSPDGRWIAYASFESGAYQVYVRPFPARPTGGKWQISTAGGRFPLWSRTSKEIFYVSGSRIMVAPFTASGDTFSPGPPRQWSDTTLSLVGNIPPYDLAPDGKRVVINPAGDSQAGDKATLHVTFLLNFFDELKRRLP